MSNSLFDLFINQKSAKIIWETLEKKYGADDAGKKKYVVGNWLWFQMVDDKPIMEQVHVYENLVTEVLNEGMEMCEILQANVLLEKFPPLWNDYRNQLKHKKRDLSLQELISHMRTEEANRLKDKQISNSTSSVKVNLVESAGTSKNRNKGKEKNVKDHQRKNFTPRQNDHKIQKPKGSCYVCGKGGHKAYQCKDRKDQQNQNQSLDTEFNHQFESEILSSLNMAVSLNKVFCDLSKLEPLDGTNYKRWSQKLLIFFEQLEIDYVLSQDAPQNETTADITIVPLIGSTRIEIDEANRKFEKDNRTARGHLLNHMSNSLFDLFINQKSAKVIWETLEKKYGADDAGKKKYVVGNWLRFQMVDDKPIMEQVHVYENLVTEVLNEGMKMCEILQANVLLEKFPPLWNDYRNQLKHKKRDLSLQELISHMRTEEANRLKDKQISNSTSSVKVNLVESAGTSKNRNKGKEKNSSTTTYRGKTEWIDK
ncbi:hypothetical protein CTI12_AA416470 [Artemisia annua]|uniref:CCHC-type domain-containing protein n=1 Tax=Artemisia annua TaxID=35608 RepID=A0A2U1M608_ARTAN|nr:hypothetical protein CTI12_AA416470 [Artemisia annua]